MKQEAFQQHISTFFKIYELFLSVDAIASVSDVGRNRELVGLFLTYFTSIVQKSATGNSNIQSHKNAVKRALYAYLTHNASIAKHCSVGDRSEYLLQITQKINNDLNNAFNAFIKAAKLYSEHRERLSNAEIIELYKRNAVDYYITAFGHDGQDEFLTYVNTYTASKSVNRITMFKQSLMEFNNAISHINSALKKGASDKNIERAEQHFNRGALDFYKSIIKELFILNKIDDSGIELLKELRCSEFNSIGEDRYKLSIRKKSLYDKYFDFCHNAIYAVADTK